MPCLKRTLINTAGSQALSAFLRRAVLLFGALLLGVSLTAWAQDQATIVGTVSDASGAVVPGAKVTVSNPDKGFTRDLVTDSAGEYTAAKIPIGNYLITAEAKGFQKLVRSGITLSVGQILRVDLTLTLGEVTQQVTISGSAVRVETETAAVSDVVTATQIENLNLNGRNYLTLTALVPGAAAENSALEPMKLGHSNAKASVSFNGNREEYSNLEIDGGNNSDEGSGANGGDVTPSLDSIAEFRISTSNYGADVGQHAGAIIEIATKSGTKDFHAGAHEFVRNDVLDANNWFLNRQINPPGGHAPKQPLKWNTFGYTLGGPFYIPGHYNTSKTKTFFFWSHEWARYREGTVISAGAPTLRMRNGDFSECDPGLPNYNSTVVSDGCVQPIDPTTGSPFPGDIVPVDPNGQALLNGMVPLPNNGVDGYVAAKSLPTNFREEQIRVDQNLSQKATLFVRVTNDAWRRQVAPSLWTGSSYDTAVTDFNDPARSAVLHLTYNFKPNLMNEFIMGYADDPHFIFPKTGPASPAGSVNKPSTWTMKTLFPANATNTLLPGISICGGAPLCESEDSGDYPYFNANPIYTWKDNVAWTAGKHTLKFGAFLEKYQKNESFGFNTQGFLTFSNSNPITTGNALADMYLGRIGQYQEGTLNFNGVAVGGYGKGHWRATMFEPYFQDDWKVTHKLTLNLGLRYYLFIPFHDISNPTIDSSFIPSLYNPANEAELNASGNIISGSGHDFTTIGNGLVECGSGGILKGCVKPYYGGIGPRFGFAYDPWGTGKTVIRGGYGIYFEAGNGNESNTEGLEGNPPASLSPSGFNIIGYQNLVPGAFGPASPSAIPFYQKVPSAQQFNLGVQHEFRGNNLLSVSYVGTMGRHLATARNLNQIPIGVGFVNVPSLAETTGCDKQGNCDVQTILINQIQTETSFFAPYRTYSSITMKQNTAVSTYHSLQVSFRHPFGHGLFMETNYTWAHSIDDSTSTYFSTSVDDNYNLSRWRATSDFNRAQALVMNYIYDLPFFKTSTNSFVKHGLGGWRISGITSFLAGLPVDFGCGVNGFSTGIGGGVRCNSLGRLKIKKGVFNDPEFGPTPTWFDKTLIGQVTLDQLRADGQPGMFGYMGRNPLTGPGRNNWDLALHKDIQLPWARGEHSTLQFRWETFNTFNHPQWRSIRAGCSGSVDFGEPCTKPSRNGEVKKAFSPRLMQIGLKFFF